MVGEAMDFTGVDYNAIRFPISERVAYVSKVHVGLIAAIFTLTLVPFFARLYQRIRPRWAFWWDDGLLVLSLLVAVTSFILLRWELFFEPTTMSYFTSMHTIKLAYFSIPLAGFTMTVVKISGILTMLRIPFTHGYLRPFLFTVMALQIVYLVGSMIFHFVACIPLKAIWDLRVASTAKCLGMDAPRIASNIGSGINITTDIILSVVPVVFFWREWSLPRERILICGFSSIGFAASISSVTRAVLVRGWNDGSPDIWALSISIATCTILEQLLAIMAVSSPSLSGAFHRFLKAIGTFLARRSYDFELLDIVRAKVAVSLLTERRKDDLGANGVPMTPMQGDMNSEITIKSHFTLSRSDSRRTPSDLEFGYISTSDNGRPNYHLDNLSLEGSGNESMLESVIGRKGGEAFLDSESSQSGRSGHSRSGTDRDDSSESGENRFELGLRPPPAAVHAGPRFGTDRWPPV